MGRVRWLKTGRERERDRLRDKKINRDGESKMVKNRERKSERE